jgi:hypothetical protein
MRPIARLLRLIGGLALLSLLLMPQAGPAQAAQPFPETGHTVSDPFLSYWRANGGLAQFGYPISDLQTEISALDGKPYTVQYFERAVFELHPENAGTPYNVLLAQLGAFRYHALYPAGAPDQQPDTQNARYFAETGHSLGGAFRAYWEQHGGLAQQGYPISDEFTEVSAVDGKPYTVQYFERAVFELHPENAGTPYNVLLTPLGTLRYQARPANAPPSPTPPPAGPPPAAPPAAGADCAGIPAAQGQVVTPVCGPQGSSFHFTGQGFTPGETVVVWITWPDNTVHTASFQRTADSAGQVADVVYQTQVDSPVGLRATARAGLTGHTHALGYFRVTRVLPVAPPPNAACDASGSIDGQATPSSARLGDTIQITGQGFHHGEDNRVWFTSPAGVVIPARQVPNEYIHLDGTLGPFPLQTGAGAFGQAAGRWAMTIQGLVSGHRSIIYFCLAR